MAGEWPQQALEDVAELSGGFAFKSEDYSADGRFVLRTLNIKDDGSIHRDDAVFLPLEKCDLYKRFELQEHDTLFVMVGATLGKVGYVRRETLPALLNQNMWRIRGRDGLCDKRYLQYAFRHTVVKNLGWASGSARDFVRRDDYRTMEIPVPPLAEQKAIAAVLGALDDKIELNRRMNATLEAMARALFQSWFVDFDPVRRNKDEGGRTKDEISALFPDSFQESALGLIPKGWRTAHLEEIASVGSGKRPEGRCDVLSSECNIPLYGGGGRMGYVPSALYDKPILFTGRVGTLGLIFRTAEPSWPSDNTLIVEPQAGLFDFTYFVLKGFDLITLNRGSTQPLLTQTDLKRQTFVLPTKDVVNAFAEVSEPIFRQMVSNDRESRTLATLRDTLLPKLLSGELSVEAVSQT